VPAAPSGRARPAAAAGARPPGARARAPGARAAAPVARALAACALLLAPARGVERSAGGDEARAAPAAAARAARRVAEGARFRVVLHFDAPAAVVAQVLETAEATWIVAADLFGGDVPPPGEPREIHVYRTVAEYQEVESKLAAGWFKDHLSFSDHATRSAHLVLQPPCSDATLAALGLPQLSRHLVAHEAGHLASYELWSSYRAHPAWFAEGFAISTGAIALERRGWSKGPERDPFLARGLVLARELVARGAFPEVARILRDDLGSLDLYERYAVWQVFLDHLRSREAARTARLFSLSREIDAGDFAQELERQFARAFSASRDGLAALDRELRASVLAHEPRWDEVARSLDTSGSGWVQQAFPDARAIAWSSDEAPGPAFALSAEVELLAGGEQELRVLLGRRRRGFVAVGLRAGVGVSVLAWSEEEGGPGRWERLARARVEAVATGRRIALRIEALPGRVRVLVDRELAVEAEVGDRPLSGPWGLAAEAGTAGVWRRVDVRRR
jgi:hypothetical protein